MVNIPSFTRLLYPKAVQDFFTPHITLPSPRSFPHLSSQLHLSLSLTTQVPHLPRLGARGQLQGPSIASKRPFSLMNEGDFCVQPTKLMEIHVKQPFGISQKKERGLLHHLKRQKNADFGEIGLVDGVGSFHCCPFHLTRVFYDRHG